MPKLSRFPLVVALLLLAPAAFADEQPGLKPPDFHGAELIFRADELPEGWSACPAEQALPAGAPSDELLGRLAELIGLDPETFSVETHALRRKDEVAVVSLVDLESDQKAFRTLLDQSAVGEGWVVQELASPMRLLVVAAAVPAVAQELARWQREIAVYHLAESGWNQIGERTIEGRSAGMALVRAAAAIEPRAGVVALIQGLLLIQQDRPKALAEIEHAFAEGTPARPRDAASVRIVFQLAQSLLEAASDDLLPATVRMLEHAVEREGTIVVEDEESIFLVFGNRYNLACAYARSARTDDALAALDRSLVFARAHMDAERYSFNFEHARDADPDMAPLRADERFQALMEKHAPGAGSDG